MIIIIFWEEHITYAQTSYTLNLSGITKKFPTVSMFVIVDLETILHTEFVGLFMISEYVASFMIYIHSKIQMMILVKLSIEFKDLLSYIFSGPYIKWC
jgi:uncharacterized membrane protein